MGVNRILAIASRQLSSGMTALAKVRQRPDEPPSAAAATAPASPEEQAATKRRQLERARCGDDGAYFEFLIERAIADSTSGSLDQA